MHLQILALGCPPEENVQSYILFITTFIPTFTRISRRLEDLQSVVRHLYPVYIQPVKDGKVSAQNAGALFKAFTPRYKEAVANFTAGTHNLSNAGRSRGCVLLPLFASFCALLYITWQHLYCSSHPMLLCCLSLAHAVRLCQEQTQQAGKQLLPPHTTFTQIEEPMWNVTVPTTVSYMAIVRCHAGALQNALLWLL